MKASKHHSTEFNDDLTDNGFDVNDGGHADKFEHGQFQSYPKKIKIDVNEENEKGKSVPSTRKIKMQICNQIRTRELDGSSIQKRDIFQQSKNGILYQRDLKVHTGCVNAVDFSPTEEWIISGGDDLNVRLWKTVDCCIRSNPTSIPMKSIHHSNIFALRFSHNTERIYSAGNDQRLILHDIRTKERLTTYRASGSIFNIATHPTDDNVIAASSEDKNVYLFDLRGNEGDGLCTKLRQDGCAYCCSWNPLNHHIVAVCNEKSGLRIYDLRNGKDYIEAGKITKGAICADWSPNGDALFCAISHSNPVYFNFLASKYVQINDPQYSNFCTIKSCTFAGQNYMLTGSDNWDIYVWKTPSDLYFNSKSQNEKEEFTIDQAYTVLKGHRSIVNHVRYGSLTNMLISCGVEKIVKCWTPLPIRNSFSNPKPRDRLSNMRLFPYLEVLDPRMESDTEEDLATLHRFDYYYESLRMRHSHTNEPDSDDSDMEISLYNRNNHNIDDDDDDMGDGESYFNEISNSEPDSISSPNSPIDAISSIDQHNFIAESKKTSDNE